MAEKKKKKKETQGPTDLLDSVLNPISRVLSGKAEDERRIEILKQQDKQAAEEQQKRDCEAKGGTWDSVNKTCILPQKKETQAGTFNEEKGGFTTDTGKFFPTSNPDFKPASQTDQNVTFEKDGTITIKGLNGVSQNLTREEFNTLRGKAGPVTNAVEQAQQLDPQVIRQQQAAEALRRKIANIGKVGGLTAAEEADINFSQAATAGFASTLPGLVGGIGVGALAGTQGGAIAGPIGLVGGAVLGGAAGFISGLLGNIKEQQRGELQAARTELTNARSAMRQLAMIASRDPANADVYIAQFNNILTRVHQARRKTKVETAGDLNAWMEDGREQLAQFDSFLEAGGLADIYSQKLITSLQTGVPLSIMGEELV